jgi:hypothetical protein
MNTIHTQHRTATTVLSGLFALTVLALVPAPANALRMPSDPDTFVPTPTALSQLVTDGHASNVRAAIEGLWSDQAGK